MRHFGWSKHVSKGGLAIAVLDALDPYRRRCPGIWGQHQYLRGFGWRLHAVYALHEPIVPA